MMGHGSVFISLVHHAGFRVISEENVSFALEASTSERHSGTLV